jgi:glucose-6-phosphate dehydrogenase assembly protein OpcA
MIRPHPEHVRNLEWQEADVSLGEVLVALTRLQAELGRHDAATDEVHVPSRNCVMNLVAFASTMAEAERVQDAAAQLSADHPMRMLVLVLEPAHNVSRLDAWIRSEAHELPDGMPIQCETVRLRVTGTATLEPAALVEPLLMPDLPSYLWWHGTAPLAQPSIRQMLDLVDALIVDSSTFERPFISTIELADLARSNAATVGLFDLQWGRLQPWRETVAQFFTPADRRPFLAGINGVGVDYVGEGRGNRVAAALLTGWLASTLHWKLQRAAAGQGGLVQAYFIAEGGHPVEVSVRSVPVGGLHEGEVAAIRLNAAAEGRTGAMSMERDLEGHKRARLQIDIGELDSYSEWRPIESRGEAELLLQMIPAGGRDAVYLDALREAADLLRALR